ncbi:MAG: enoyl-CoA hydratase-related protein [Xanthomonadaceae bacterium]|nr:enoyl-CoA hydratase-related protein [Xanthomonadaceae bacterium]MDP2185358.1 enoyl-CoA hydratase-related protein [Xanthomonadales bacterium]MDZ4117258.1 enoyl-CoA hydratase-related protein [Xanthomonadaceae bacterium]MDZ4376669.1 enoyl-CoA hydratase-related protein [Xanthomonadaceae bacterium]
MAKPPNIEQKIHAGVCRITLDRPQVHNAFDADLIAELTDALQHADADPEVRAVLLTGRGGTFSAGADLNWMRAMANASEAENRDDSLKLAALMRTLNFLGKPTIARVNGAAYGGGVGLIACCDIAIGVSGAKFALSEVKLGLVPAVISPYVVAAMGARAARRAFITGEVFDAEQAQAVGLLHECVAAEMLDEAVERCLHWLQKGGPVAQSAAKRLALAMAGMDADTQQRIDSENATLIARLRVSPEGQHGLAAFLDKRAPDWASR